MFPWYYMYSDVCSGFKSSIKYLCVIKCKKLEELSYLWITVLWTCKIPSITYTHYVKKQVFNNNNLIITINNFYRELYRVYYPVEHFTRSNNHLRYCCAITPRRRKELYDFIESSLTKQQEWKSSGRQNRSFCPTYDHCVHVDYRCH